MKRYSTFILLLLIVLFPRITKAAALSPKQVIEKYYNIMMDTCWGCRGPRDLAWPDNNPSLAKLITTEFQPVGGIETLFVALPPNISNCNEKGDGASCMVTSFILGNLTPDYNTFCEQHDVSKTIYKLKIFHGQWKISGVIDPSIGETESLYDNNKLISVKEALKRINEYITAYSHTLRIRDVEKRDVNRAKKWIEILEKNKKAIEEIKNKTLLYGFKENEVYRKDFACPKPNPKIIKEIKKELKGNKR